MCRVETYSYKLVQVVKEILFVNFNFCCLQKLKCKKVLHNQSKAHFVCLSVWCITFTQVKLGHLKFSDYISVQQMSLTF